MKKKQAGFRKLTINENGELFRPLISDSLLWAVFTVCSIRARRTQAVSVEGIKQMEFVLSENEYEKFGLKKSQRGQIRRRLMILIRLGVVSKTETRIGSEKSNVYAYVNNKVIDINPEIETKTETKQRANRERIETNKNVKKLKNVKKRVRTYKSIGTKKKYTLDQIATTILEIFNQEMDTSFKSVKPFLSGIEFWLETYAPDEIERAIKQLPYNGFWKDKMTPTMLFRRRNPRGESVDYIGELINSRRTKWNQ